MSDYPRMRQMKICPICLNDKDQGLLLCWSCHHKQKAANNGAYSAKTTAMLARREEYLQAFETFEDQCKVFIAEFDAQGATKH